jgi:amino acid transporter
MTLTGLRRLLVGERLPTTRAIHERLPKLLALPVFGSDPISSSAYATEEIMLALAAAGSGALAHSVAIAGAIAVLFGMVSISYRQTVIAYPSGGGAYIVARQNLGTYPGLIAAAALLTDYVLTVAVSMAAGVAAIASAAPALAPHRVALCLACIAVLALANLRGARESGKLFAGPTYAFVGSVVLMLVIGTLRLTLHPETASPAASASAGIAEPLTLFLVLRAFASGCAALTGIEAISNGVPAFRPPESRNAATTLGWMVGICLILFLGITALAHQFHILPDATGHQTVLSMLGRAVFGDTLLYYFLQATTAAVLVLAANTSFADFPRLSSILARDGFAPRQLANVGDRLVFSNGIVLLGAFAAALVVIFRGQTHLLIPLYAVGVFISFTLSQAGMVRHWHKVRTPGWLRRAVVNALGALATAVVFVVVGSMKFSHGAWIIMFVIPLLVVGFRKIGRHYHDLARRLSWKGDTLPSVIKNKALVLVPGVHPGVLAALNYAQMISSDPEALFIQVDPGDPPWLKQWDRWALGIPLTVLRSSPAALTESIIRYTRHLRAEQGLDMVTLVVPELVVPRWRQRLLRSQFGLRLKYALLFEPGIAVANVRYRAPA